MKQNKQMKDGALPPYLLSLKYNINTADFCVSVTSVERIPHPEISLD